MTRYALNPLIDYPTCLPALNAAIVFNKLTTRYSRQ